MCLHTKFHANRTIFGEVITFHKFSRWRPARSRDITICNSGPHTKSPRCSELAVQIWFRNLDYFWIYRNFSILFVTLHVKCLTTPTFRWILGLLPQNLTFIILTPKRHILGWKRVFEPSTVKIHPGVRPVCVPEEKKPGQDNKQKGTTECNISHMWGEAHANDNVTKFGTGGRCPGRNHTRQILRWKFKGFRFYGGGRILAFSIDFAYGPTVLCYSATCDGWFHTLTVTYTCLLHQSNTNKPPLWQSYHTGMNSTLWSSLTYPYVQV